MMRGKDPSLYSYGSNAGALVEYHLLKHKTIKFGRDKMPPVLDINSYAIPSLLVPYLVC